VGPILGCATEQGEIMVEPKSPFRVPRRPTALIGLALAGLLAIAAGAFAAAGPLKGATYSGRLKPGHGVPLSDGTPIALKVSPTGKKVTVSMESFPLFCEGGGPPQVVKFKAASIKNGKFKASGTETTEQKFGGGLTANAMVTGTFSAGKAKGSFEVTYTKATTCDGKTTYSAVPAPQ
jgi:hypothetical protein